MKRERKGGNFMSNTRIGEKEREERVRYYKQGKERGKDLGITCKRRNRKRFEY